MQELDDLGRDRLAPLGERLDLARVDDLDDLVLDRRADPGQLLRLAVERELGDRAAACRARAWPPGGRRARGRPPRLRSRAGRPGARAARPHPRCAGASSPPSAMIRACARSSACPPTTSARTSSRWCRALGEHGVSRARDRRQLAGRDRRARRPAGALSSTTSRCSTAPRKEGLGPAYLAGFRHALADGAELILEMDCDFSHDPADVPRLVAAAARGRRRARLALRRRRLGPELGLRRGGFVSAGGSLYARVLLGVPASATSPAASSASGARCSRRSTSTRSRSRGYAFQIETTYRALRAGFRVVEVPIALRRPRARAARR